MGSYRFEISNGRAGCQNKECKDKAVKIPKGELRVGSWVESERFQSYQWRHWGCTTPKVIENIITAWEELRSNETDYDVLDGWEDLPEDSQSKIRTALAQGHVDDEDWKGDLEVNRPGCTGFRMRAPRGKKAKEETSHDQPMPTIEGSDANGDSELSEKPKPKAKKATAKAVAESSNDADASEKANPKAKRAPRVKKAAAKDEPEASDPEIEEQKPAANSKKTRAKKAVAATPVSPDAEPKKRGRPSKKAATDAPAAQPAKKGTKRKTSDEETQEVEPEKPKRGRGNGKTTKINSAPDDTETAVPAKPKRGRKKASD